MEASNIGHKNITFEVHGSFLAELEVAFFERFGYVLNIYRGGIMDHFDPMTETEDNQADTNGSPGEPTEWTTLYIERIEELPRPHAEALAAVTADFSVERYLP